MTHVYVAGVPTPLVYPGSLAEFRRLEPDHGGALRWENRGNQVMLDTNVASIVALVERPM